MADKIGLVLAGGGARGAYEAGVLSVLLPALEERGQSPRIIVGTSVGAISAAFVASSAHLGAQGTGAMALQRWREVDTDMIMRSVALRVPLTAGQYVGEFFRVPGLRVHSLTDTAPLRRTLDAWVDWDQIHANVASGVIDSAAVVATHARSGRTVVFADARGDLPGDSAKLEYVPARMSNDLVRASAAIPIVFPPVKVELPDHPARWYLDGGTRLNTPIKPAIDQGATHVVVIALDSVAAPELDDEPDEREPTFGDAALHALEGALVDPLVEDVRMLAKLNDAPGYERVPYILVSPERRDTIGAIATEVFEEHYRGLRKLGVFDLVAFRQLLGGAGASQGALISLLFFEQPFIERLLELGRQDAQRWLDAAGGPDGPWHAGPVESRPGARTPV